MHEVIFRSSQHPCERKLRHRAVQFRCHGYQALHFLQLLFVLKKSLDECVLPVVRGSAVRGICWPGLYFPLITPCASGEKTTCPIPAFCRAETRPSPHPAPARCILADCFSVVRIDHRTRANTARSAQPSTLKSPSKHFALPNQIVHHPDCFFQRSGFVKSMTLINVDVISPQSTQALMTILKNMFARKPAIVHHRGRLGKTPWSPARSRCACDL